MKKSLKCAYLCVETLLLAAFTWADAVNRIALSNKLKFLGIAVNTLVLLQMLAGKKRIGRCRRIVFALLLTLAADVFLILLDTHYLLGVLLFCAVECCYAAFLTDEKHRVGDICLRLGLYAAVCAVLWAMGALDALTLASAFSMVQLSLNVLFAWARRSNTQGRTLLALGLSLFWCCDACVGLRNVGDYIASVPSRIPMLAGAAIWWFYLPSQVLILLSLEKLLRNDTDKGNEHV